MTVAIPADSWWHRRVELEAYARTLDKTTKLALKQGGVWGLSSALTTFATTVGRTVYIPPNWTFSSVQRVLPHEVLGHVQQFRWAGFGIHPTVGIPLGLLLYFLIPFPVLFAWVRYRAELHAETKAWHYHLQLRNDKPTRAWVKLRAEVFPKKISGKEYVYAVPRCWALWGFRRRAGKVLDGY